MGMPVLNCSIVTVWATRILTLNDISCTHPLQVCVHYTGRLGSADGEIFDSSVGGEPFTFRIGGGEVIAGCDEGVASMCVGERAEFLIEPHKAYGSEGSEPEVPPNATLHFDIELIRNTALPRVLLGHDSEEPFTMGEGVVDAGVTAGLFEDAEETITTEADHSRDGDGGGGGMFDDATDDGTDGMFADADGSSIADQERVRTAGSGAVERRRRDEPDNIFSQLAGGGDGDELGEQRNGVVRFNIGADLQDSAAGAEPIPDVQDADSFPTIGKTDVVATPGWPRQPPPLSSALKTSSESRSAQPPAARAPTLAATASSCLGATASEPSWLGEGGVDGSPFPERSEDDILREAAELSGKPAPSDVLVVDTAGFLRSSPLETLGREIFTIPEVCISIVWLSCLVRLTAMCLFSDRVLTLDAPPFHSPFRVQTPVGHFGNSRSGCSRTHGWGTAVRTQVP
jgi:hypothetical protein